MSKEKHSIEIDSSANHRSPGMTKAERHDLERDTKLGYHPKDDKGTPEHTVETPELAQNETALETTLNETLELLEEYSEFAEGLLETMTEHAKPEVAESVGEKFQAMKEAQEKALERKHHTTEAAHQQEFFAHHLEAVAAATEHHFHAMHHLHEIHHSLHESHHKIEELRKQLHEAQHYETELKEKEEDLKKQREEANKHFEKH